MISHERVMEMLQEEIKKVKDVGYIVEPINPMVQFPKATSFGGMCHRRVSEYKGKRFYCDIRISEFILNGNEQDVREVIMHEVTHAVKLSGNHGHGVVWKSIIRKINEEYKYNLTHYTNERVSSCLHTGKDKITKSSNRHLVRCKKCGYEWNYTRESRTTLHPELYTCKCGGKLERVY